MSRPIHISVQAGGVLNHAPQASNIVNQQTRQASYRITEYVNRLCEQDTGVRPLLGVSVLDTCYIDSMVASNGLVRWADDINQLKCYYERVNSLYDAFDPYGTHSRNVLNWLNGHYRRLHVQFVGDQLFDELFDKVCSLISSDFALSVNVREEDMQFQVRILLVHAFIGCYIFEPPVVPRLIL